MKSIFLSLFIKLPEDFNGGVNEALLYYLEYRKEKKYSKELQNIDEKLPTTEEEDKMIEAAVDIIRTLQFKEFLQVIKLGYNVHGFCALFEYNENTDTQTYLKTENVN